MTFGVLLNFLLPALLIISIALLVYALTVFIRSRNEHSPSLVRKSLKIAIFPLLYILGVVLPIILINRINVRKSAQLAADAVGIYQYNTTDSLQVNATLKSDKTFYLQYGPTLYTGKWAVYRFSQVITLQDKHQSQPFAATLRLTSGKVTALVLSTVKDSIVLIKTD